MVSHVVFPVENLITVRLDGRCRVRIALDPLKNVAIGWERGRQRLVEDILEHPRTCVLGIAGRLQGNSYSL